MPDIIEKQVRFIAIYARVSTANQEEEGTIENQLHSLEEYAKKNDYVIVDRYLDDGWSGDSLVRPELDRLRSDVIQKKWNAVLIYDPDRLARRYSYQELIMDELKEKGVEVMFITVTAPKNSEDKILYGVRGIFAEYERAKITERFRLGKLRKVRDGHLLLSEAAYGYRYIPKKEGAHGYYVINEEEAAVVRMIFHWVADEGLTLRKVVKRLNDLGIKPRRSKRGVWNTSTLTHLLRNSVYIGEARWGSSFAVIPERPIKKDKYKKLKKTSRKLKPREEWFIIPVPPIIDKDLFMRTQVQLKANFDLSLRNKKNEYLLSGKIFCVCGRSRCGEGPQHGRHLYYRCTDRVKSFPLPPNCHAKGINARIADKMVWDKVVELMSSEELLLGQVSKWQESRKRTPELDQIRFEGLKKRVSILKSEEERYNKAYGAGVFSIEQLKQYTSPIRDELVNLEKQVEQFSQIEKDIEVNLLPVKDDVSKFVEQMKLALRNLNFGAKQEIVRCVIDKIIGSTENLQVFGYIPVNSHVEYKTINRNRRFAKRRKIHAF